MLDLRQKESKKTTGKGEDVMIAGHTVHFPFPPYGPQKALMGALLRAVKGSHNALLEAPTGTGKTLALLCSALAFVRKHNLEVSHSEPEPGSGVPIDFEEDPMDSEVFVDQTVQTQNQGGPRESNAKESVDNAKISEGNTRDKELDGNPSDAHDVPFVKREQHAGKRVRIYYGSRTHTQIKQVIAELGETTYAPKMTILGSRKHLCIHPGAEDASDLLTFCRDSCDKAKSADVPTHSLGGFDSDSDSDSESDIGLQDLSAQSKKKGKKAQPKRKAKSPRGKSNVKRPATSAPCRRKHPEHLKRLTQLSEIHPGGKSYPFDMEDLVHFGRRLNACPYFASRDLEMHAEIVFCPYNYLLVPEIRETMGIDVTNALVILDEAHNVEDVCRGAASCEMERDSLEEIVEELKGCLKTVRTKNIDKTTVEFAESRYQPLLAFFSLFLEWTKGQADRLDDGTCMDRRKNWTGDQVCLLLMSMGIDCEFSIDYLNGLAQDVAVVGNLGPYSFNTHEKQDRDKSQTELGVADKGAKKRKEKESYGKPKEPQASAAMRAFDKATRILFKSIDSNSKTKLKFQRDEQGNVRVFNAENNTNSKSPQHPYALPQSLQGKSPPNVFVPEEVKVRFPVAPAREMSAFLSSIRYLYVSDAKYRRDFRLVLERKDRDLGESKTSSQFRNRRFKKMSTLSPNVDKLSLACFNPAVAFETLSSKARSVVLASGTLAPMGSFASELGCPFKVRLETQHVVKMENQVVVGMLGRSPVSPSAPQGVPIECSYKNTSKFAFLDGVGETILGLAQCVPDGLLVFFSSYGLKYKLVQRWKRTGLYDKINRKKPVYEEMGGAGGDKFKKMIDSYKRRIKMSAGRGAILLAVCRGKVSEGVDFADESARAVVCVGIPYASTQGWEVKFKKEYNDQRVAEERRGLKTRTSASRETDGMLNGHQWYNLQAFRALNQAMGRCIRHIRDFGAIIMLDERFFHAGTEKQVSKWMASHIVRFPSFEKLKERLGPFYKRMGAKRDVELGRTAVESGGIEEEKEEEEEEEEEEKEGRKEKEKSASAAGSVYDIAKAPEKPLNYAAGEAFRVMMDISMSQDSSDDDLGLEIISANVPKKDSGKTGKSAVVAEDRGKIYGLVCQGCGCVVVEAPQGGDSWLRLMDVPPETAEMRGYQPQVYSPAGNVSALKWSNIEMSKDPISDFPRGSLVCGRLTWSLADRCIYYPMICVKCISAKNPKPEEAVIGAYIMAISDASLAPLIGAKWLFPRNLSVIQVSKE